ncbi:N-6 DNA methylase [Streptomyces sp. NPDC048208]|uniref:N-6 DNA methylase n=1 Tax=Streptomyces sp. NPDC048208 TaxID=3365515 RepID=UPI00371938ED
MERGEPGPVQDNATEVTAAGIARLAGVGRAAVSNWRRRHSDFPKPVGGTETSPSFALAEVEAWLRRQGKLAEVPLRERVWQQLTGHPEGPATALVHAGCVLLLIQERPTVWLDIEAGSDERLAARLPGVLDQVIGSRFGCEPVNESVPVNTAPPVHTPSGPQLLPSAPLLRGTAELAAELGARQTFEFLLGRYLDVHSRQFTPTPAELAGLMAELAGPADTVLDPACGTGALLRAVDARPHQTLYAQDSAPDLVALTALRLALRTRATVRGAVGDTLRADAYPELRADVVLCHPPFNERNWGHDELAYDARWEYGFPARTESELAWVQHALARLADGGTAVLLMPPAAASRRSGRRIRADLLRRGALRAVLALPVGAAPPYNLPLHLWVLRRPDRTPAAPEVLLVDTGAFAGEARGGPDWQAVRDAALDTWRSFARDGRLAERPGLARSVPVIELLDDDVDLAPARHLPPPAAADGVEQLAAVRDDLAATLRLTTGLTPPTATPAPPARWPLTTIGELARGGALMLRTGGTAGALAAGPHTSGTPTAGPHARVPVLTDHDVLAGSAPSGTLPETDEETVLTEPGDVVVPVLGGGSVARVVDAETAGAALGRNLVLLRPDAASLDAWFLAGFLRGTVNNRQASSYASTATRLDVRRLQLPRLPLDEQRRYGDRFRALDDFERALRQAGRLGEQLLRGMYDGLTDGTVAPH